MVVDEMSNRVFVFDTATDTVVASLLLPGIDGAQTPHDCEITKDGSMGIISSVQRLWVVDLTTDPPSFAPGVNPVFLTSLVGLDSTISRDGRFAILCGGLGMDGDSEMLSVDLNARTVADSFDPPGGDCSAVDTCFDGSLLITSNIAGAPNGPFAMLRRLQIDATGHLSATGDIVDGTFDQNVICAPNANTAVVVEGDDVVSYAVDPLALIDMGTTSSFTGSAAFHPQDDVVYLRSSNELRAIGVNQSTGAVDDVPSFMTAIDNGTQYLGVDQIAVNASGTKVYVSQPPALSVYDATTGVFLTDITHPDLVDPVGVCIQRAASVLFSDGFESGDVSMWDVVMP